ncbi:MAG: DUF4054 domain-containing protein [Castellaniella sp.]|uniref:DUF4054 domain-containing protein n=1 Tax=Castellaniella sp. TaxID=1955812 RepID=UPI003C78A39F
MTPLEILAFELPGDRYTEDDRQQALALAANKRPWCLSEAEQDAAQALYAAWLLVMRVGKEGGVVPTAGIKSESEGDLSRTYASGSEALDQFGFKARYDEMARQCPIKMQRGACVK